MAELHILRRRSSRRRSSHHVRIASPARTSVGSTTGYVSPTSTCKVGRECSRDFLVHHGGRRDLCSHRGHLWGELEGWLLVVGAHCQCHCLDRGSTLVGLGRHPASTERWNDCNQLVNRLRFSICPLSVTAVGSDHGRVMPRSSLVSIASASRRLPKNPVSTEDQHVACGAHTQGGVRFGGAT